MNKEIVISTKAEVTISNVMFQKLCQMDSLIFDKIVVEQKTDVLNVELMKKRGCHLLGKDFFRFQDGKWINDEIINSYFNLLRVSETNNILQNSKYKYCVFLETYFMAALSSNGKEKISLQEHWTFNKDTIDICMKLWKKVSFYSSHSLESIKKIIIPCNCLKSHWNLIVVDVKEKTIKTLDSYKEYTISKNNRFKVKEFMKHIDTKNEYTVEQTKEEFRPQQINSYDCGMFLILNARKICLQDQYSFSQSDIFKARKSLFTIIYHQYCDEQVFHYGL